MLAMKKPRGPQVNWEEAGGGEKLLMRSRSGDYIVNRRGIVPGDAWYWPV